MTINNAHKLTGWQLWQAVTGTTSYTPNKSHTFETPNKTWRVWMTCGRGKNHGTYCHLGTKVQVRVTENGKDTGRRIEDVAHYRGKANEIIGQYPEVS